MATVIPVAGETRNIPGPTNLSEVMNIFLEECPVKEGLQPHFWPKDSLGEDVFVYLSTDGSEGSFNRRATRFLTHRGGSEILYGPVIFLSSDEWMSFRSPSPISGHTKKNPKLVEDPVVEWLSTSASAVDEIAQSVRKNVVKQNHRGEDWVQVEGDIYPIRAELRHRFGAFFDTSLSMWLVPARFSVEAQDFVDKNSREKRFQTSVAEKSLTLRCSLCRRERPIGSIGFTEKNGTFATVCVGEDSESCSATKK